MKKIIIETKLYKDEANPLEVKWEMSYDYEVPADVHPDNWLTDREEHRAFGRLISAHIVLADKISVDVTLHYKHSKALRKGLETDLLNEVEYTSIEELAEANKAEAQESNARLLKVVEMLERADSAPDRRTAVTIFDSLQNCMQ